MKKEISGVALYTNKGMYVFLDSSNESGNVVTKEDCFKYCNESPSDRIKKLQANKLIESSVLVDKNEIKEENWFLSEYNYKNVTMVIEKN